VQTAKGRVILSRKELLLIMLEFMYLAIWDDAMARFKEAAADEREMLAREACDKWTTDQLAPRHDSLEPDAELDPIPLNRRRIALSRKGVVAVLTRIYIFPPKLTDLCTAKQEPEWGGPVFRPCCPSVLRAEAAAKVANMPMFATAHHQVFYETGRPLHFDRPVGYEAAPATCVTQFLFESFRERTRPHNRARALRKWHALASERIGAL